VFRAAVKRRLCFAFHFFALTRMAADHGGVLELGVGDASVIRLNPDPSPWIFLAEKPWRRGPIVLIPFRGKG
jgi:hypothetical protein